MISQFPSEFNNAIGTMNKWTTRKLENFLETCKENGEFQKSEQLQKIDKNLKTTKEMIKDFFKAEPKKVGYWIQTPNPLLGEISPLTMIVMDRFDKLEQFILSRLWENSAPGTPPPPKLKLPKGLR
jgi:hypothetical protein